MDHTIGIDISKDQLDVHRLSDGCARQFPNTAKGHRMLARWAPDDALFIFEPTGPYHRALERLLASRGVTFVKVNPRQAHRFVQAEGRLSKTDRADAASLARMGAAMGLAASKPLPDVYHDLKELRTARDGLVRDRIAARTRQRTAEHALLKQQLARRLQQISRDIAALDCAMDRLILADPGLHHRYAILTSIPGLGPVSARLILIEMPELGQIDAKAVASLAGLAPMSRQSGQRSWQAHIAGGRAALRRGLYMPTLSMIRHHPPTREKYRAFTDRGKAPKVAITALMRKLIILANALIRDNRTWSSKPA